ncbi:GerAB/ArcD/ProY family transporter [Aquibacillus halophilus]|uniref:GerAB/ArcD/ProY family transporter n=1 Tax=Aquibacillus halophilus TaxID=930132 RepID=A0A6A8D8Y2_9BACI|nr:endospore germination permease [Aquibacillus halophilus]MRH42064.1 GerAB/ArcD/ProY family transporter [Aquibacillus halophilus]
MIGSSKEKISQKQLTSMIILFTIGSAILFIPSFLANVAKQDAWISAIVATVLGLFTVLFYSKLYKLYPKKSYFECATFILGKWIGGAVILITYIYFFILSSLILWDLGEFLKTQVLVQTPIQVILILFMLTVIYTVRLGIENVGRTSEVFLPWVLGLFLLMCVFLIWSLEKGNLLPYLEKGVMPVLHGSYYLLSFPYLELIIFLMITPYVNKETKVQKSFLQGTLVAGGLLITTTFLCILVLGADVTARNTFPVYVLGKMVSVGEFLERLEIIIAIIWFLSIYFKLAIVFYVLVASLSDFVKAKDYRPITLPLGMLLVVMSPIMFTSTMQVASFDKEVFFPLTYIVGFFLPLIVYIAGKIKHKKRGI